MRPLTPYAYPFVIPSSRLGIAWQSHILHGVKDGVPRSASWATVNYVSNPRRRAIRGKAPACSVGLKCTTCGVTKLGSPTE